LSQYGRSTDHKVPVEISCAVIPSIEYGHIDLDKPEYDLTARIDHYS